MTKNKAQNKFMFLDLLSTVIQPFFGGYTFKIIKTDSWRKQDLVQNHRLLSNSIYLSSSWSKKRLLLEALYRVLLNEIVPEVAITYNMTQRVRTAIWFVETISIAKNVKNRALQLYVDLFAKELKKWKPTTPADHAWKVFASLGIGRYDCQDSFDQKEWQEFYDLYLKVSQLNDLEDKIKGYIALYYKILEEIMKRNMREEIKNAISSAKETLDEFNLPEPKELKEAVGNLYREVKKVVVNKRDRFIAQRILISLPEEYKDERSEQMREFEESIANADKDKILKKLAKKMSKQNKEDNIPIGGEENSGGETFFINLSVEGGNTAGIGKDLFKDFETPLMPKDTQFLTTKSEIKLVERSGEDVWHGEPEIKIEESIIEALRNGFIIRGIPIIALGISITETESKEALIALVDTSGSMADKVNKIKAMLLTTIQKYKLKEIAIIGFGDYAFWIVKPTKDIYHAIARIKGIFSSGGTSITPALKLMMRYPELISRGELAIITDGDIFDLNKAFIYFKKLREMGLKRVIVYLCETQRFIETLREAGIEVIQVSAQA